MIKKNIITSDDILGKLAVDPEGDILGTVMMLHIEKDQKKMLGFTIDQGFMKPNLYVGIKQVKSFGVDTLFLEQIPGEKYKGLEVLDYNGRKVGYVVDIEKQGDTLKNMILQKKWYSQKRFIIDINSVFEFGVSIILKKGAVIKEKVDLKKE